ncbi:hypothetical protein AAMO2058_000507100 [Amorphochlora amoebiformis]
MLSTWAICMLSIYGGMLVLYLFQMVTPIKNSRIKNTYYISVAFVCDALVFTVVVILRLPWQSEVVVDSLFIFLCYWTFLYIGQQYCQVNYRIASTGRVPKHISRIFHLAIVGVALCMMASGLGQISTNKAWWRAFRWIGTAFISSVFGIYGVYNLFRIRHHIKSRLSRQAKNTIEVGSASGVKRKRSENKTPVPLIFGKERPRYPGSTLRRGSNRPNTVSDPPPRNVTYHQSASSTGAYLPPAEVMSSETTPSHAYVSRLEDVKSRDRSPHHRRIGSCPSRHIGSDLSSIKATNVKTTVPIITRNMKKDLRSYRRLKLRIEILLAFVIPVCVYAGITHTLMVARFLVLSDSAEGYIERRREPGDTEIFVYFYLAIGMCPRIPNLFSKFSKINPPKLSTDYSKPTPKHQKATSNHSAQNWTFRAHHQTQSPSPSHKVSGSLIARVGDSNLNLCGRKGRGISGVWYMKWRICM